MTSRSADLGRRTPPGDRGQRADRDSGMPGTDVLGESSALVVNEMAEHNTVDLARFGPRRRAVSDADPQIAGTKRADLSRRSAATTCWLRGS